jgi:hypothetical protein
MNRSMLTVAHATHLRVAMVGLAAVLLIATLGIFV